MARQKKENVKSTLSKNRIEKSRRTKIKEIQKS